jgi:predicted nucleotidyltransferase
MSTKSAQFEAFLREAVDPSYYQETFYFTMLIAMTKDKGGSRDETKNDIRALPEVLTVTLVEKEKGGVQKDLGTKFMSTLKVHVRKPKDISKDVMMRRIVQLTSRLSGVIVLRYKEKKPKQRKKVFRGPGSYKITEVDYQKVRRQKAGEYAKDKAKYISTGPQKTGGAPFNRPASKKRGKSAAAGGPWGSVGGAFGLEEAHLDEAMKTAADLEREHPEVVVVVKSRGPQAFSVYYALRDTPEKRLKAHDLDRQEAGIDIYGTLDTHISGEGPRPEVFMVKTVKARDGFGPLLYDVALEVAGESGLMPDEFDVSEHASRVWKYYDTGRPDVDSQLLDDDSDEEDHLGKAYYKTDTATIDSLQSQDKYIQIDDSDGPLYEGRSDQLLEDVLITIGAQTKDDLLAFDIQPDLNQKIWNGDISIRPGVKGALMDIADEFLEGLDMDLDIKDIIITGSIANYNWSKFSDIDLHILVDFAEVNDNEEMVKKFFDAVRSNWNKLHNITVKGHEVEIYIQDAHEPHISTGVYSLMDNQWLVKPKKVRPAIDRHTATKKMKHIAREIDKLSLIYDNKKYEEALEAAQRVKDKIKRMRQSGLDQSGIYSPENLAFKMLRRSGDIEQLFSIYTRAYDQVQSLDQ